MDSDAANDKGILKDEQPSAAASPTATASARSLFIEGLHVYYGAIHALKGLDVEVNQGEIVSIIGSNGAGKSTLLRTISGLVRAREGHIFAYDEEITNLKPHLIVQKGIVHCPEGRRIFTNLSVIENLKLGAYCRTDNEVASDLESVLDIFPRLRERINQNAGTLSGGEQQMLAIGRALMARPKVLLLDEPSLGLAPNLVMEIFKIIKRINDEGTTVLLVEQNAHRALEIATRAYVLETGRIVLQDTGKALLTNPKVREAYLGG
ncbi:MAG: ABC transporter ATP-binding protein [Fimbriimonadales bacterium]|nr:MAG: ABC transporter ATP-binding protein [Fimbriimonadales bacterium]